MPAQWCEEDGLRFLSVDYRGETTEQHFETLGQLGDAIRLGLPSMRVLVHVDPDHRPDSTFLAAVKRGMREVRSAPDTRVAFVGMTGLGLTILRGLNLVGAGSATAFSSREKALAYLRRP